MTMILGFGTAEDADSEKGRVQAHVRTAAHALGFTVEWMAADHFGTQDALDRPGEPLTPGQTANLTQQLATMQPHLIVVDLDDAALPWQRWIGVIKSSAATRRLPVLAITADSSLLGRARSAGADGVLLRDPLQSQLGALETLIGQLARPDKTAVITTACQQPLSELARAGIALFNDQQFYEAHHGLEDAWNADQSAAKELYRAILQVAVAYLQIERGNYRGAVKMFLRVQQWLAPLPATCRGINIAQLRDDATAAHHHLTTIGADQIAAFDRSFFKKIEIER